MKKFKKIVFAGSIIAIFLFNMMVSLDGTSVLGKDAAAKKTKDNYKYEDKFDVNLYLPGPVMKIGICCDIDKTDGCWKIWRKCADQK